MCGIAGVLERGGRAASTDMVDAMVAAIGHRGPDRRGVLVDGPLGLGAARLSIVDLTDGGAQPFEDAQAALTFNGEIYNHRTLRRELETAGVSFRGRSDTEVLFHALRHWGVEATLPRLRGMFAFAFADRDRREVSLCRDPLGIKPLLWSSFDGRVAWASEAKALGAIRPLVPDPVQALFALTGRVERSSTMTSFSGIRQVPAGHWLRASVDAEPTLHMWWQLADQVDESLYAELDGLGRGELTERFDALLVDAVGAMVHDDAPAGTFVSGGVDSSLIAAVTREGDRHPPQLFTADVGGARSELEAATRTADHLGQSLEVAPFAPGDLLDDWAHATWHLESPLVTHVNALPFGRLAAAAHAHGVRSALTGEGADELFFGYGEAARETYPRLVREPAGSLRQAAGHLPGALGAAVTARTPGQADFLVDLVGHFQAHRLGDAGAAAFGFLAPEQARRAGAVMVWLGEHLPTLLHRNDAMGMATAVEARFPYLDEAVVRFGMNLPVRAKVAATRHLGNRRHPFVQDKVIVRRAAARRLPPDIAQRPKAGFPMYGHHHVRTTAHFWTGGYVQDLLGLPAEAIAHLTNEVEPYHAAKLASVEVFGRVFALDHDTELVAEHVRRHARVTP